MIRAVITLALAVGNYFGLMALFEIAPPMAVFSALILAVLGMVIILIPVATKLGLTNDGAADDGGGWGGRSRGSD